MGSQRVDRVEDKFENSIMKLKMDDKKRLTRGSIPSPGTVSSKVKPAPYDGQTRHI